MTAAWISEMQRGDMSHFDSFYRETRKAVFYNIFSYVRDYALSEDVLQETYVRFLEKIADLDERKNILGYLFVLSRNIALDEIRKRKKQAEWESVENDREYANEENHAGFEVIEKCKELMNEKEFEIVILHVVNAMTHKEIARLKKKPLGTITWAYNHAIKKLKKGWDRS